MVLQLDVFIFRIATVAATTATAAAAAADIHSAVHGLPQVRRLYCGDNALGVHQIVVSYPIGPGLFRIGQVKWEPLCGSDV